MVQKVIGEIAAAVNASGPGTYIEVKVPFRKMRRFKPRFDDAHEGGEY